MLISYTATLLSKEELVPDIYRLQFSFPQNPDWTFQAGQYMIFHLPISEKGHPARRLYSIASPPSDKKSLEFIIELVPGGLGSGYITALKENDQMTLQGPAGMFTLKPSKRPIVMLATGTGIAPMHSMIKEILTLNLPTGGQTPHIYLFWGLKYVKDIYLKQEFDAIALRNPHFQYSICLSREENEIHETECLKGRVTQGWEKLITDTQLPVADFDFYLCGGPQIIESLRKELSDKGVSKEHIYSEKFS